MYDLRSYAISNGRYLKSSMYSLFLHLTGHFDPSTEAKPFTCSRLTFTVQGVRFPSTEVHSLSPGEVPKFSQSI